MKIGKDGLSIIKHYEGLRLKAYLCPAGKLTVGYGHVILPGEKLSIITDKKAHELLASDVSWAEDCVFKSVKVPLLQNQFDALVSFIFNIGGGAFKSSTMLKMLNNNRLADASIQFSRWTRAAGKVMPGLVSRRESERKLFADGDLELK
jgi:lysozyme